MNRSQSKGIERALPTAHPDITVPGWTAQLPRRELPRAWGSAGLGTERKDIFFVLQRNQRGLQERKGGGRGEGEENKAARRELKSQITNLVLGN